MSAPVVLTELIIAFTYFCIPFVFKFLWGPQRTLHHKWLFPVFVFVMLVSGLERLNRVIQIVADTGSLTWVVAFSGLLFVLIASLFKLYTLYRCKPVTAQCSASNSALAKNNANSAAISSAPEADDHSHLLSAPTVNSLGLNALPLWVLEFNPTGFITLWQSDAASRLCANAKVTTPPTMPFFSQYPELVARARHCAFTPAAHEVCELSPGRVENNSATIADQHALLYHVGSQRVAVLLNRRAKRPEPGLAATTDSDVFLKQAFNASIAGVFVFDSKAMSPSFVNARFSHITGYAENLVHHFGPLALLHKVHPEDRKRVTSHLRHLFTRHYAAKDAGAVSSPLQFRFYHASGKWVWLMAQYSVLALPANSTVQRFMGSFLDISPLRKLQDNLVKTRDEAQQANQAKSEFLANMSHEIRTPMNAVLALTDLVLDMELGTKQREYLNKVQASSHSLLCILNDILDYSKLEAGKLDVSRETFDVSQVLSEVAQLYTASAINKGLVLTCEFDKQSPRWIISDPMRLKQILTNLIGNAVKFTECGSINVRVSARTVGQTQQIEFHVIDTGIGIVEAKMSALFKAFSQADNSISRRFGGSGLGLSISAKLAALLGGKLSGTSVPDKGSHFVLSMPAHIPPSWPSGLTDKNLQVCLIAPTGAMPTITGYSDRIGCKVINALPLHDFATHQLPACDVLIMDISALGPTALRATVARLLASSAVADIRYGCVFIGAAENNQLQTSDVILNLPSVWVFAPFLPSDLERAIVSLIDKGKPRPADKRLNSLYFPACTALVVEDNETNQYVAEQLLGSIGFTVILAGSGAEALQQVAAHPIDVILMDLQMPEMDGYSTTVALRKQPELADIPIIAMSAAVLEQDRQRVIDVGMDAHIPKPVDRKVLLQTLLRSLKHKAIYKDKPFTTVPVLGQADKTLHKQLRQLLPGFDIAAVMRRMGGSVTGYRQLIAHFIEEYDLPSQPYYGLDPRSADIHTQLHSLKGLAMTIGASRLGQMAAEAERQAAKGHAISVIPIAEELSQVVKTLKYCQAHLPPADDSRAMAPLTDLTELKARLKKRSYLRQSDIERYRPTLNERLGETKAREICRAIGQLDYTTAIDLLPD